MADSGKDAPGRKEARRPLLGGPLWHLTRARLLEFLREPGALLWVFVFPVLLAIGLGIAFRSRPEEKAQVVVAASTPDAKGLASSLGSARGLATKVLADAEARIALRRGKVDLVVYGASPPQVGPPPAGAARPQPAYTLAYDPDRAEGRLARALVGEALLLARGGAEVVAVNEATTAEQAGRYIDFLIPGLIGLNLMGSAMWGIGFVLVHNRTKKLLKRFAATPMHRAHYLLSFMLSRLLFLVLEVAALLAVGWLVFGVKVHGSLATLAVVSLVGTFGFTGLALLVAARPQSIEAVSGWMNFVMLPMWVLSGAFFSYERFPEAVHPFIQALPLTALCDALRLVVNAGAPITECLTQLGVMAAWGLIPFVIALKIFRWR
ncbi:MAG: ABC transporter permease [Polyangia bacterium]|jgi:ABC-type multidrug transport system permease subunit|nr:ABC transporter permease [Polyangia bacterium]